MQVQFDAPRPRCSAPHSRLAPVASTSGRRLHTGYTPQPRRRNSRCACDGSLHAAAQMEAAPAAPTLRSDVRPPGGLFWQQPEPDASAPGPGPGPRPGAPWGGRLPPEQALKVQAVRELIYKHLQYQDLPPRLRRVVPFLIDDMQQMDATLAALVAQFGSELTFSFIRRVPYILNDRADVMLERCAQLQALLMLRPTQLFPLLRKNPALLIIETSTLKRRLAAVPRLVPFSQEQLLTLMLKYPIIVNVETETLRRLVLQLRQLSATRETWRRDFDDISPSLLAFYIKDNKDLIRRLQYLAATGACPGVTLRAVFKPSNKLFARRHRGFKWWLEHHAARRAAIHEQQQQRQWQDTQRSSHDHKT